MPQVIALTCPVCAAPLKPDSEKCSFCGSYIVIKTHLPKLDRRTLNQAVIQEHITDFRTRVRANAYDEEAHYGLGLAYYNLGLINEAIDELSQAARLIPENPHIQAQLGVVLRDSWKAGNHDARQQMHTRIHNALLLDPNHVEANRLKAELLIGDNQFNEALTGLEKILPVDQEHTRPKIIEAANGLFVQRAAVQDWHGVRRCWYFLGPIDSNAARVLMVKFLNMFPDLVPKTVSIRESVGGNLVEVERSKAKRILFALGGAIVGLVIGFVQLAVVTLNVPSEGFGLVLFLLSFVLQIALPIAAAIVVYRRSGGVTAEAGNPFRTLSASKREILAGVAELPLIKQTADDVIARVIRQQTDQSRRRR